MATEAEPDASGLPVLADAVEHSFVEMAGATHVDGRLELNVGANAVATAILLSVEGRSAVRVRPVSSLPRPSSWPRSTPFPIFSSGLATSRSIT